MLQVVGQYCFLSSTLEKVEKICQAAVGVLPDVAGPVGESMVLPVEGSVQEGVDSQVVVTGKVRFISSATSIRRLHFAYYFRGILAVFFKLFATEGYSSCQEVFDENSSDLRQAESMITVHVVAVLFLK